METEKDKTKSIGGRARAAKLTPERRSEIAKKAAASRWDDNLLTATHEGEFTIGDEIVSCAVLPNGLRVITQATFLRALGRSRSPKAGTGVLSTVDDLPFFLQAEALKPFISEELAMSTTPIFYRSPKGSKGVGYDARLLPQVAEVYLKYRDSLLIKNKKIPTNNAHIIKASDILLRGLASVGIISLVDEATGFQKDRAKDALAKILEAFVAKELQPYVKTFPADYYEQLFRIYNLPYPPAGNKGWRPSFFGKITNDVIYDRLAPDLLPELKKAANKTEKKAKLFQWLTTDIGHPKLREHLASIVTILKLSRTPQDFKDNVDRIHVRYGQTHQIPFDYPGD
ncbi:MAG: P63C domain-containing protein [Anaerolineales bacterium]|nr:P63C domain-containing protein [Anaerolineales bacterium]